MATFPGTDNNDSLTGAAENDTLTGGPGSDSLDGAAGNDVLAGGAGGTTSDDWFEASAGSDTIYGGDIGLDDNPSSNFNQINYFNRGFSGVQVTFGSTSRGGSVEKSGNGGGTDTFFSIDGVHGTNGADTFIGGSGPGTQRFVGMGGADIFDGTLGVNEVDYRREADQAGLTSGLTIDLSAGAVTDAFGTTDTLIAIERIRGTRNNDHIIGNELNNRLRGDSGRDWLEGGTGNDWLEGGLGFGDYLEGGAGNDTIFGGNGDGAPSNTNDVAAFRLPSGTPGTLSIERTGPTTGVVKIGTSIVFEITQLGNGANAFEVKGIGLGASLGTDIVRNIDEIHFEVPGGSFLKLQVGVSVYGTGNGDFLVEGGILNNFIDANFIIGITASADVDVRAGEGSDTVYGHDGRNSLHGDAGNDTLYGRGGKDLLNGNAGADYMDGGYGNDTVTGGTGKDVFLFTAKLGTSKTDRKVNFDTIKDFSVRDDSLWLDNAIFKKLGSGSAANPKLLASKFFKVSDKAKDTNDYIIYNKTTGVLSYDADGSGTRYAAIEFAQLKKGLALSYKDIFVV